MHRVCEFPVLDSGCKMIGMEWHDNLSVRAYNCLCNLLLLHYRDGRLWCSEQEWVGLREYESRSEAIKHITHCDVGDFIKQLPNYKILRTKNLGKGTLAEIRREFGGPPVRYTKVRHFSVEAPHYDYVACLESFMGRL